MKPLKLLFFFLPIFIFVTSAYSQVSKDAAVQIEVTVSKSPLSITLHWPADVNGTGYDVYRRDLGAASWGKSLKHLSGTFTQFIDTTIITGKVYEYYVKKIAHLSGNLSGSYLYKITFVTDQGETQGGSTSAALIPSLGQIAITSIPIGATGITKRNIYRTVSGGADGTEKLLATIGDNVTTAYIDNIADASLGAGFPVVNTAMTPPPALNDSAGKAGLLNGTYLYKVTFVTSGGETNGGTTSAPVILNHQRANLTAIAKGGVGTISRKIYRTPGSGADGTQRLVGTISDTVTTIFTDSIPDGSLGVAVPTINMAFRAPSAPSAAYILLSSYGYTESAIDRPAVNDRGKLILLVDNTFSQGLKTELSRLEQDLWNDGWQVIRHDVRSNDSVPNVKAIVVNDFNNDPTNTKALFIFGHVPVPYSGFINPDGHPDHYGAWPADVYYGEFNSGDWADNSTDPSSGRRPVNHNIAGDGKFDVSALYELSSTVDLMIGRVDLSNMDTTFGVTEYALLKKYLDKDHNFRTGILTAPPRALLEDDFGYFGGEAFASSGWRNFAPLVGNDSIEEFNPGSGTWMPVISTKPFLWAYGCGGGWDNGAGGAGSTHEYATQDGKAIFTMLFGSYFGDWNTGANFLRAPLTTSYGLSSAWSGRPYWQFFPMGLGEPLGYCAKLTQNNQSDYVYNYAANWVHIALMGDPTLVMHPYVPPTGLSLSMNADHNIATLTWLPSSDKNILGYNVYRSKSPTGTYELLTPSPVSEATFSDKNPLVDTNAYMVRAIKLETTPSGSYYNLSAGTRSWVAGLIKNGITTNTQVQDNLQIMYTMDGVEIILNKSYTSYTTLAIYDASGRIIKTLDNRTLSPGVYRYDWQTSSVASGIYFVRAIGMREPLTAKILVVQ